MIRLGENLSEGEDGVFTFNEKAHTVTINSSVENGTKADISGANQFAAYALAFEFSKTDTGKTEALNLKSEVERDQKQTVNLTGNVKLTNTGIIGIGKDNIEKGKSAHQFKGTLDGDKHTITLDIGSTYGNKISEDDLAAGQLYVIDDKSHKEIAQLLSIKQNTSASQLHKAKSMLAQKIKHYRTINSI